MGGARPIGLKGDPCGGPFFYMVFIFFSGF